ncbi:hypothetical protein [Amycolatopsis sp. CA-230715]|uniref:hypothetical protein n=1 Tax=Amycolatopsis sp. CA-230715 TaxID=2745196 RepID=UPI001C013D59|nr:hypothetical protein [Amycolatopsis sp. CA-230715]QWF85607.1 hypothetical protein HUW46_09062 [Amycolatopsis sp. CA-230715]
MQDLGDMALTLYTGLDVGNDNEQYAAMIAVDRRGTQRITPFGTKVDLLLEVALKYGLTRLTSYRTLDPSSISLVPGWALTVEPAGFVTIDYGPGQRLINTRLECPDRWLAAATARRAVNLLVVGGAGAAPIIQTGTDALAGLDAAAQRGLLAGGAISFAGRPGTAEETSEDQMNWPVRGLTISGQGGVFALNISSPNKGLISSFPLHPHEVTPLAKAFCRAAADSDEPLNVSEIVHAVTGRRMPHPAADD